MWTSINGLVWTIKGCGQGLIDECEQRCRLTSIYG